MKITTAPPAERMFGTSSPRAKRVKTYPGIASGSTSTHSIQERPGKSQKDTRAASEVPSSSVPVPTPTIRMPVAANASGRKFENFPKSSGATM